MKLILDLILIAIAAFFIMYGYKRGFFKSVMFFGTGVASLFLAYAFAPGLGKFIKEKFIITNISQSLEKSFTSIARTPSSSELDIGLLASDPQFAETVTKYGANEDKIGDMMNGSGAAGDIIEKVARAVADPVAAAIGRVIAFIVIFLAALVILKVLTGFIGLVFRLPVLKTLDRTMGLVFGIVGALFFVWTFSMAVNFFIDAFGKVSAGSISEDSKPVLVGFFAKYNPVGLLSRILGY